ncbi:MAG: hypothetical protein KDJ38_06885 [Gammaproteobacteria bacterium]|nr:hypothetical protein [Gammaproteobacteria bacterium]
MQNESPSTKADAASGTPTNGKGYENFSIEDHARSLCRFGLSARSLADLEQLPLAIQNWSRRIRSLQRYNSYQKTFGDRPSHCLKNIEWLAAFQENPIPEPAGFPLFAHPQHASPEVGKIFRTARQHARKIAKKLKPHEDYIDFAALPEHYATLGHLRAITGRLGKNPFSSRRRHAKSLLANALFAGEKIGSDEVKKNLNDLCDIYEEMEKFRNVSVYKRILGPGFKGYHTRWDHLKAYIKFSRAIRYTCKDNQSALNLIENWDRQREDFFAAAQKAASVHRELDKLARLTMLLVDNKDSNPRIETILRNATIAESEIRQHLAVLASEVDDNTLTPATIVQMQLN